MEASQEGKDFTLKRLGENLKSLYLKKSPHWPTLKILDFSKILQGSFLKEKNRKMSYLTARKKAKNDLLWPNSMAFHTEKDLKSKNVRGKKVYILARDVNTENKAKQISAWKWPIIWSVKVKLLGFFLQNVHIT